jgi:hypothetical protein
MIFNSDSNNMVIVHPYQSLFLLAPFYNLSLSSLFPLCCSLCDVITVRGDRIEVCGFQAYDATRGAQFLGQSWLTNAVIKINTTNAAIGWAGWPFRATEFFWESFAIKVRSSMWF